MFLSEIQPREAGRYSRQAPRPSRVNVEGQVIEHRSVTVVETFCMRFLQNGPADVQKHQVITLDHKESSPWKRLISTPAFLKLLAQFSTDDFQEEKWWLVSIN